jgi:HlyD family secretion protein
MKKMIYAGVAIVIVAGAYFLMPRKSAEQPAAPGAQPRSVKIIRGDLTAMVSATGKVEPIQKVEVKSKGSGQIMEMPVEEGDRVQKGSLIAHIDETDPRNDYEQAVADLELAKATVAQAASNLKRQEELFKRGLLSQAELDQVRLEEVKAKAQLIKAQTQKTTTDIRLKDSIVRSPISGIILQKNVEPGQIISSGVNSVSGGTLIVTVATLDSVYVYADVDEVDIGQVKLGQAARVVPDAFPDDVFWGTVRRIAPLATVEQNVTTFNVTIVVANTSGKLKAGMNASVELTVTDRHDILLIPKEALKDIREVRAQMMAMAGPDSAATRKQLTAMDSLRAASRARFADGAAPQGGMAGRQFPQRGANGQGSSSRRFVLLKTDEGFAPRPVEVGVSNYDYAEVVRGLEEGETVMVFSSSRAAADRQRFMERIRGMNSFGGFGGQQSPSGGQQRPASGR